MEQITKIYKEDRNITGTEMPKYKYHLLTWGGFYNDQHQKLHGYDAGDFLFDTLEEREAYIKELQDCQLVYPEARELMIHTSEGYNCDTHTVLHRIVKYKEKEYYTKEEMFINYPFSAAQYHLEYKWQPGFNDYPLGEDHDYENDPVEIVQEWITGAFDLYEKD